MDTNGEKIEISIKQPVVEDEKGFTTFLIIGEDRLGTFEIRRRFNDFHLLRDGLKKRFPGCFIPAVPEKKVLGNKQLKLVQDRKRFLDYFCKQIAKQGFLYYSDTFQLLIRNKGGDLQKLIDSQPSPDTISQIQVLRDLCPSEIPNESLIEARNILNPFEVYLKKSQKQLRQLRDEIKIVAEAKRVFNDNLNICNTSIIPEYQKTVYAEYVNQNNDSLLFNANTEISQKAKQLKDSSFVNSFDIASDMVAIELREVICFQEAIQARQHIEQSLIKLNQKRKNDQQQMSKLSSGKTTFKSIFTKGNKEQQIRNLEKTIENDQKQIDSLGLLIDLVLIYQAQTELPRFKSNRKNTYYQSLNQVAKAQVKHLSIYGGMMKIILSANQNMKYE